MSLVVFFIIAVLFTTALPVAAVTVTSESTLTNNSVFECGQQGVVKCKYDSSSGSMIWQKSPSTTLSNCFVSSDDNCSPSTVDDKTFGSTVSDLLFVMTINPVKMTDNDEIFECVDTETGSFTVSAIIPPKDDSTTTISTLNNNEIILTTSCVYPDNKVTITWTYYKENDLPSNAKSFPDEDTTAVSAGTCTGDCSGSDVKTKTSTISIEDCSSGAKYHFQATVRHADANAGEEVVRTSAAYPYCPVITTTSTAASSSVTTDNSISSNSSDTCSCKCKCPCKIIGGKLAYTVIDYVLDAAYIVAVICVVVFNLVIDDEKKTHKAIFLVASTVCVVLLDIGLTIYLFLEDCEEDCECACNGKTTCIGVTVGAWLLSCVGYVVVFYYFIFGKGKCCNTKAKGFIPCCFSGVESGGSNGPQNKVSEEKGQHAKFSGGKVQHAKVPGGKGQQNSGTVGKGVDASEHGTKNNEHHGTRGTGRPVPLPPQKQHRKKKKKLTRRIEDSSSEVSRKDVIIEPAQKRPLPSIGGANMGTRGLSANFEEHSDFPQVSSTNRLQPLSEDVQTEKKKKKKKKKTVDNEESEEPKFY